MEKLKYPEKQHGFMTVEMEAEYDICGSDVCRYIDRHAGTKDLESIRIALNKRLKIKLSESPAPINASPMHVTYFIDTVNALIEKHGEIKALRLLESILTQEAQ